MDEDFEGLEFNLQTQNKIHNAKGYILAYITNSGELRISHNIANLNEAEIYGLIDNAEHCRQVIVTGDEND